MFGADAAQLSFSVQDTRPRQVPQQYDAFQYLYPKFNGQSLWGHSSHAPHGQGGGRSEDCILIAEFSEQEGPRPVLVIPKDGGQNFDKNEFSVKILAVDHQSSISEGCEITEDAQVVMSDPDTDIHAFIHHIVLNDIQARGYVRPFCISYVTSDPVKVMKCYEEISSQMKKVARLMKYGNRLVFMRDLEKHLEDLSFTKARLLITQSRNTQVSAQGDSDLLNALNTIRQCMEEVTDILNNLKPVIQLESELADRFQHYELTLKGRQTPAGRDPDSSSLKDFDNGSETGAEKELSGSYKENPEFSLFSKSKDQKPKMLDVSAIRGKRRFDRSLRGLHELCSWGAKEGLQRLRAFREFIKRDLSSIYTDELDMAALEPDIGVLSFGYNTVGANFLSAMDRHVGGCCVRRLGTDLDYGERCTIASLGSLDSFKSLATSFQSFEDEAMFSANSSMVDPYYSTHQASRQNSISDTSTGRDSFGQDESDPLLPSNYSMSLQTAVDLDLGLSETGSFMETLTLDKKQTKVKSRTVDQEGKGQREYQKVKGQKVGQHDKWGSSPQLKVLETKVRASSHDSDFDSIDLVANEQFQCSCDKINSSSDTIDSCDTCGSSVDRKSNIRNKAKSMNIKYKLAKLNDPLVKGESTSENKGQCNKEKNECNTEISDVNVGAITDASNESIDTNVDVDKQENAVNDGKDGNKVVTDSSIEKSGEIDEDIEQSAGDHIMTDSSSTLCEDPVITATCDNSKADVKFGSFDNSNEKNEIDDSSKISKDEVADQKVSETISGDIEKNSVTNNQDSKCDLCKATAACSKSVSASADLEELGRLNCINEHFGDRFSSKDSEESLKNSSSASSDHLSKDMSSDKQNQSSTASLDNFMSRHLGFPDGQRPSLLRGLSTTESSSKRKWRFLHAYKNIQEAVGPSIQKVLCAYNNLQHAVYSLLVGRPVVVIGTSRQDRAMRDVVNTLALFVPSTPSLSPVVLLCQLKQIKMAEVFKFHLRGIIRPDKRSIDYLLPHSVRRYVTVVDLEKSLIYGHPYQGTLLSPIVALHNKKKSFKSDAALFAYLQILLEEISAKAFHFYHSVEADDTHTDFRGTTLPHRSAMLELTSEKYLNRAGIYSSDCRIIKHLAELVKVQQIEEDFRCKYLTDPPACPFPVMYQTIQTFKL